MTFLKAQGIRGLAGKNDWPRFVQEEPEVYEKDELDTLFAKCDAKERLWFEFFLMTGMREQEVMHCSWADINLARGTVTVRYKPEYGFSPKNYREREIPIPAKLGNPRFFVTSCVRSGCDFVVRWPYQSIQIHRRWTDYESEVQPSLDFVTHVCASGVPDKLLCL